MVSGITAAALRRGRLAVVLHAGALLSVIFLGLVVTVLAVQWEGAFAGAPSLGWIAFYMLVAAAALAAAARLGFRA